MESGCSVDMKDHKVNGLQVKVINVSGFLDAHSFPEVEKALNIIMDKGSYHLVLNLGGLDYISSAGLGVLIGVAKKVREKKGDLKLSQLPEKIYRIVNLLGFSRILDIFNTDEEALSAFKDRG